MFREPRFEFFLVNQVGELTQLSNFADAYPNLLTFFDETFAKYRKEVAFVCMDKAITYDQVDKLSKKFASYLHSRGLEPGDKIALMMPNLLQYPIALFGTLRAGLIVVNTNPLYTPREMKHQFTDAGCKAIVIADNFAANLEKPGSKIYDQAFSNRS